MDIGTRIQQLEEMIREAKSMPLSASALLNREELLELVASMKEALPEEIKQARWVVKDREELLTKARHDADSLAEKGPSISSRWCETPCCCRCRSHRSAGPIAWDSASAVAATATSGSARARPRRSIRDGPCSGTSVSTRPRTTEGGSLWPHPRERPRKPGAVAGPRTGSRRRRRTPSAHSAISPSCRIASAGTAGT